MEQCALYSKFQCLFDMVPPPVHTWCSSLVFQDRTSTITSLEELLNVTGINQTEEINFSEIAREVEAQHGTYGLSLWWT